MKNQDNNAASVINHSPGETFYTHDVATQYEALRKNDRYWEWENQILEKCMLALKVDEIVADCPVGTGRFFDIYSRKQLQVWGIDISEDMLREAEKKIAGTALASRTKLTQTDVSTLEMDNPAAQALVCFRLLHLISDEQLSTIVQGLSKIPSQYIFLQVFGLKDYSIKNVVRRIGYALASGDITFIRKLKYVYRSLRAQAGKFIKKTAPKPVKSHEKSTFCDTTYSHDINTVLKAFSLHGFVKTTQFDFMDKGHLMGESASYLSMILVLENAGNPAASASR
jgi:hypothetical protein